MEHDYSKRTKEIKVLPRKFLTCQHGWRHNLWPSMPLKCSVLIIPREHRGTIIEHLPSILTHTFVCGVLLFGSQVTWPMSTDRRS